LGGFKHAEDFYESDNTAFRQRSAISCSLRAGTSMRSSAQMDVCPPSHYSAHFDLQPLERK